MKKRILSGLSALAMVLTLLPTAALAGDDDSGAVCTCTALCTEENMDMKCPICGAADALPVVCGFTAAPSDSIDVQDLTPVMSVLCGDLTLSTTDDAGLTDDDYTYESNLLTILSDKAVTVSGTTEADRIIITDRITANLTLDNLSISSTGNIPLTVGNSTVTLNVSGTNSLSSAAQNTPALFIANGSLTIQGDGSLTAASSGQMSTAIGTNRDWAMAADITIQGKVTVTATATGNAGAGIGSGGYNKKDDKAPAFSGSLTIQDNATVNATGNRGAGIGAGGHAGGTYYNRNGGPFTGSVTICDNATVTATSNGNYGAGIGVGARYGNKANNIFSGSITIEGNAEVTATGGTAGAGLGGGSDAEGTIAINGGVVHATGGTIGIGFGSTCTQGALASLAITGNALVYMNGSNYQSGTEDWRGTVFNAAGMSGTVYGNVTPADDFTIDEGVTLTVPTGATLTVSDGKTLTNNGTLTVDGTLSGSVKNNGAMIVTGTLSGSVENNGTLYSVSGTITDATITGDGAITGGELHGTLLLHADDGTALTEEDYTYDNVNNIVTIKSNKAITVSGSSDADRIEVGEGVTANLTLDNVSIDVSGTVDASAIYVNNTAALNLTLTGSSTLKSGSGRAGIGVPSNATLTITDESTGSLAVTGGRNSAGIGGDDRESPGNTPNIAGKITIAGGSITAQGGQYGAGIGAGDAHNSGAENSAGIITITGGVINAIGGVDAAYGGAGIGGGSCSAPLNITISGGIINATGSARAAGIGGGYNYASVRGGGPIKISGGTITATGGETGIGSGITTGGVLDTDITLTITGGSINATTNMTAAKDTNGEAAVTLHAVMLAGVKPATAVSKTSFGSDYGLNDTQTDKDGKLYFWLPADTAVNSVTANDTAYFPNPSKPSGTLYRKYTVTYDANGGSGSVPDSAEFFSDDIVPSADTSLTRSGYRFSGWSTDKDAKNADPVVTMGDEDLTLYAVWKSTDVGVTAVFVAHTAGTISGTAVWVTLSPDTTIPTTVGSVSITPAAGAVVSSLQTADAGKTWTFTVTAEDGITSEEYTIQVSVSRGTDNEVYVTLSFDTNGGSSIDKLLKNQGAIVELDAYTPTKDGCRFDGWYADSKLTDKVTDVALTQKSMTVYAKWTENVTTGLPFTDVPADAWFYEDLAYVYENGLFTGTSANTFSHKTDMTREQMWTVLARMDGEKPANMEAARNWAMESAISDGTNPASNVTREQFVTLLWRYAGAPATTELLSDYADFDAVSDYAKTAMAWAVENGILNGVGDNRLDPAGTATRAQVAAILHRFCENIT